MHGHGACWSKIPCIVCSVVEGNSVVRTTLSKLEEIKKSMHFTISKCYYTMTVIFFILS